MCAYVIVFINNQMNRVILQHFVSKHIFILGGVHLFHN